jgi:hypothetical protein
MFGAKQKLEHVAEAEMLRARVAMRGMAIRAVFYGLAAIAAFIGVVMLAVACAIALSDIYGPSIGTLLTAGIAFLLALLLALLAGPLSGRRARELADQAARSAREDLSAELRSVADLARAFRKPSGEAGKSGKSSLVMPLAIGALAAGFLAGISPRFRRLILGRED